LTRLTIGHEIKTASSVRPIQPDSGSESGADALTPDQFETYDPDVILFDGLPDPIACDWRPRRIPWDVERRHLQRGGALVLLRAIPDLADTRENAGLQDYGFPLASSKHGGPVWLQNQRREDVVLNGVDLPMPLTLPSMRPKPFGRLVVRRPWVLKEVAKPLLRAPESYDGQGRRLVHEHDLDVAKPYVVAAWGQPFGAGPVFLFTGDMFSDSMIAKGQNGALLGALMETIAELRQSMKSEEANVTVHSMPGLHLASPGHSARISNLGPSRSSAKAAAGMRDGEPVKAADFGIVTALRDEMLAALDALGSFEEVSPDREDIRYYYRSRVRCLDGSDETVVCVLASDMGQLAALNATRDLIGAWNPRHVLLVGIAGGVKARKVNFGDIVVPTRIHHYPPAKLSPEGRLQRGASWEASAKLLAAVEALAIQKDPLWPARLGVGRPRGQPPAAPRVRRGELASGEEVWANLDSPIVQDVLARFDKVNAVDNEAAGVFQAVHEAVYKPDVLVVKAVSDLVNHKDDRWREYAAHAASAFAMAVIEKVGTRW
jgi:nucleoside phosphorylase